jgi:hypothetical protein
MITDIFCWPSSTFGGACVEQPAILVTTAIKNGKYNLLIVTH